MGSALVLALVDQQIPLDLAPVPEETVRVMVIRVEALTPRLERADLAMAAALDGSDVQARAQAEQYFHHLGRFAEPRLRRALGQSTMSPAAARLLDRIASADVRMTAGE
ncbi:MAG: hypothetical protein JST00_14855 [Deltaproteobacteria bacterium]|nr:hypothetical protein [Deltaproteobacteria bacterium]